MQPLRPVREAVPPLSMPSKQIIPRGCPLYRPMFCTPPPVIALPEEAPGTRSRSFPHRRVILSSRFRGFLPLLLLILLWNDLSGQEIGENLPFQPKSFSGSISLATEYRSADRDYHSEEGNLFASAFLEHRFSSGRIPVDMMFSTLGSNEKEYYLRLGIHPEFLNGGVRLHAGDFYTDASELTLSTTSLFGGGVEVEGGIFRGAAWYGEIDRPWSLEEKNVEPEGKRIVLGGRLGLGKEERGFVDLTANRIADNNNNNGLTSGDSISEENLMAGIAFFLPLLDRKVSIRGEGGVAAWSSDLSAAEIGDPLPFFTPRQSSQFDGAASLELRYTPSWQHSAGISARWIGPGYVSLAQPYLRNDLFAITLNSSLTFLDGRLTTNGSVGMEQDNLRGTREGRTTQLIGTLFTTYRPADWLMLSSSYNDFGATSDHANDTLRYGYVSRSFLFSPTFFWKGLGGSQIGSINLSVQDGQSRNPGGEFVGTSVESLDGSWSLLLPSMFSTTTRAGYSRTEGEGYRNDLLTIAQTLSHTLSEGKLSGSFTLGLSHYLNEGGIVLDLNGSIVWNPGLPGTLSLTLSNSLEEGFGSQRETTRQFHAALRYGVRL